MKNMISTVMKTIKIFMILVLTTFAMTSCVQDDEYTIPESLGDEENEALDNLLTSGAVEVSIGELAGMYLTEPDAEDNVPFLVETDIYIKGYITSSDQTGNFFKEIYLQDAPENPISAVKIILEQVDTYNQYNVGREVYVNLKGLYIGEERVENEVITIGGGTETDAFGTTVTRLSENQKKLKVLRSQNTMSMVPKTLSFSEVTANTIGMFVKFENVEFAANLNGLRYFDPIEDFDTQRTLQACTGFDYGTFILETSSFASFKNELLPTNNGSISGIITKDFSGETLLMALNSTDDVNFTNSRCTLLDPADFSALISEDFESSTNNANINIPGWTNYAEAGTRVWRVITTSDSGNPGSKIASMGAFNSGQASNIAWLISPSINLDAQDLEFLNFRTSNSFSDGSELEVLISTNWDGTTGNISSATWTALPATIVSDAEYFQNWVDSGVIDLSGYSGSAYIAFKYIGGDNAGDTIDGNYEIDNFKVLIQN